MKSSVGVSILSVCFDLLHSMPIGIPMHNEKKPATITRTNVCMNEIHKPIPKTRSKLKKVNKEILRLVKNHAKSVSEMMNMSGGKTSKTLSVPSMNFSMKLEMLEKNGLQLSNKN